MKKFFNMLSGIERSYKCFILTVSLLLLKSNFAYASQPKLVTGTIDLFTTASNWLLGIIPVGAGFVLGFHALQKTLTDDDAVIADKNKKMKNTIISAAIAETATGLVRIILGFYS